jgi:hypothetical protein
MMRPLLLSMSLATITALTPWMIPAVTAADAIRDDATGLVVTPPDGYVVQREATSPAVDAAARFSLKKPLDPPSSGCTVETQLLPSIDDTSSALARALSARSQEGKAAWRDKALLQIMSSVSVRSSRPYSQDGIEGLQVEGWPRREADGSGSKIDRTMLMRIVVLKPGNGYTLVTCRAGAVDFPTRRAEFEEVVHGVKINPAPALRTEPLHSRAGPSGCEHLDPHPDRDRRC